VVEVRIFKFKNTNLFEKVLISGHSEFSHFGTDIVCSAISSVVFGSIAFFSKFYPKDVICSKSKNLIYFYTKNRSREINLLFSMMIYQLKNISNFYPSFICFYHNEENEKITST
jgi:uncharacterized protein YsxB (DUF464 family)